MGSKDEVREAFYYLLHSRPERRQASWDGGKDRQTGRRYTNKWSKIADFLNERGCNDVYGFIYANLKFRTDLDLASVNLQPIHLYSDSAWTAYQAYLESLEGLGEKIRAELDVFRSRYKYWRLLMDDSKALAATLSDSSISVSPILRYYLARKLGFDDIANKYFPAAEYQFVVAAAEYRKYLKDIDIEGASCKDWV